MISDVEIINNKEKESCILCHYLTQQAERDHDVFMVSLNFSSVSAI